MTDSEVDPARWPDRPEDVAHRATRTADPDGAWGVLSAMRRGTGDVIVTVTLDHLNDTHALFRTLPWDQRTGTSLSLARTTWETLGRPTTRDLWLPEVGQDRQA